MQRDYCFFIRFLENYFYTKSNLIYLGAFKHFRFSQMAKSSEKSARV